MSIFDRFKGNQFELPEEESEKPPKTPDTGRETEAREVSPDWKSFSETREFAKPLLEEEEAELGKAAEEEPKGFLIDLKKKFGKYRAFLEISRIMIGALSAHPDAAGRTTEEEVAASGAISYEQMAEQDIEPGNGEDETKRHEEWSNSLEKDPNKTLDSFGSWQGEPFAGDLLKEAVHVFPDIAVEHLPQLQESEHFQEVVDALVERNAPNLASFMERDPANMQLLRPALEGSHSSYADDVARMLDGDLSKGELHKALSVLPVLDRDHLSPEAAKEIVHDAHRLTEARFDSFVMGNEGVQEDVVGGLTAEFTKHLKFMNEHKGQADRFTDAKEASPRELYGMMALAGDEGRPTTDQGVFKEMFVKMIKEDISAKELVDSAGGMHYQEFVSTASANGTLDDFLRRAETPEERHDLMARVVDGLDTNPNVEDLSAVAQTILKEGDSPAGRDLQEAIAQKYEAAVSGHDVRGEEVYGYLSGLYGQEADSWLKEKSADYKLEFQKTLPVRELLNAEGENIQVYHFYNDPDGDMSFKHFVSEYEGQEGWSVTDHDTYVEVKKTEGERTVRILANKPEFATDGENDRMEKWDGRSGITDIQAELSGAGKTAQVEVHRGHSYWADSTVESLSPDAKLYFDGSCGGASRAEDSLEKVPQAQLIYNGDEGMAVINDSFLSEMNDAILRGEDLDWGKLRGDVELKVSGILHAEEAYQKYVFPDMDASAGHVVGLTILDALKEHPPTNI